MIRGIKNHLDVFIRYDQTRNATENIKKGYLMELVKEGKLTDDNIKFLESCGMSAFSTEMEGLGYLMPYMYFTFPGQADRTIQMDDAHMITANDPKYEIHKYLLDNRLLDTYITLAIECYDCPAYSLDEVTFGMAADLLIYGEGIQVCLKKPGHWIALIDYDDELDAIRFHDSWGGRPGLKNKGFHEIILREEWSNVQSQVVVYPKKKEA